MHAVRNSHCNATPLRAAATTTAAAAVAAISPLAFTMRRPYAVQTGPAELSNHTFINTNEVGLVGVPFAGGQPRPGVAEGCELFITLLVLMRP
jgi:hypothetical protein